MSIIEFTCGFKKICTLFKCFNCFYAHLFIFTLLNNVIRANSTNDNINKYINSFHFYKM